MSALSTAIRELIEGGGGATRQLPKGLHLVIYHENGDNPAALVVNRAPTPTIAELDAVRAALIAELDRSASHAMDEMSEWREMKARPGRLPGYYISWRMLPVRDAFSRDAERAHRARVVIDQRDQRIRARREQSRRARKPAVGG